MADTCIICLGEIHHIDGEQSSESIESPALEADDIPAKVTTPPDGGGSELVATLLPCEHFLHDACLKPWVERANSCPICRATFNMVELRFAIGGIVESSYAVQDKRQVADIDPSLIIEDDFPEERDEHEDPCLVCEEYGDESQLLLCDGCNNTTHVFCAGLDSVPSGSWFCFTCLEDPQVLARHYRGTATPTRRRRIRRPRREIGWERAWRSIFDRLHFDIDFPFAEEEDDAAADRAAAAERRAERREIQAWRRRFDVAAQQGAATRFRNTANILRHPVPPRTPKPESQEDRRAWMALDRARRLENGTTEDEDEPRNRGRKRKSRSNSPRDATPPPTERKLKRPRFLGRRPQANADPIVSNGESSNASTSIRMPAPAPVRSRQASSVDSMTANSGANNRTTFLQSLLNEVESHPGLSGSEFDAFNDFEDANDAGSGTERSPSPQLSPATSPVSSSAPTPRAMTPPPLSPMSRPASPPPLSSHITPIFPPAPEFSPFSPAVDEPVAERARGRQMRKASRHASNSPEQSPSHSPTRATISYEMKDQITNMVSSALKPFYHRKEVDKDRYTSINKSVSRMLYDKIWDAGGLLDATAKERWQKVAAEEVKLAVHEAASDRSQTSTPPVISGDANKATTASQPAATEVAMRPAAVKV